MTASDLAAIGDAIKSLIPENALPAEKAVVVSAVNVMVDTLSKLADVADSLARIAKALETANDNEFYRGSA